MKKKKKTPEPYISQKKPEYTKEQLLQQYKLVQKKYGENLTFTK